MDRIDSSKHIRTVSTIELSHRDIEGALAEQSRAPIEHSVRAVLLRTQGGVRSTTVFPFSSAENARGVILEFYIFSLVTEGTEKSFLFSVIPFENQE